MKKTYSQPDILFENFSLSTSIAEVCAVVTHTPQDGTCGVMFGDRMVFIGNVDGCAIKVADGSPVFNGLCYHVPIDTNALFNS